MIKRTVIVYKTEGSSSDNTTRFEYKDHVIQILAVDSTVWHCVLSEDGQTELFESTNLLDCFMYLDKGKEIK